MSAKPNVCPVCKDKPKPMRRWHDKHNRVFNHLKWQVECNRGCVRSMAGSRSEAVYLYNSEVGSKRAILSAPAIESKPKMTIKRLWNTILYGAGSEK